MAINQKGKTMRFVVIGTGYIFKSQKYIFKITKRAKIVALVDKNEELVKKYAKKMKIPWFTSSQDLYASDVKFDAVYIATPHNTHFPLMKEAITHKKHILCDKPITHSVADGEEIIRLANQAKVKIGINYQNRYTRKVFQLVQACHNNQLGKILYAKVSVPWYRDERYFSKGPWRKKWETAGGGCVLTTGSHYIDILLWALGKPVSVFGKYATRLHDKIAVEVEDVGMGIIEFKNGVIAQILSTSCTKPKDSAAYIEVYGEKGTLKLKLIGPFGILKKYNISRLKYKLKVPGFLNFSRVLNAFIDWIWEDKLFFNTPEYALETLKVVLGLYESARIKKEIMF